MESEGELKVNIKEYLGETFKNLKDFLLVLEFQHLFLNFDKKIWAEILQALIS